MKKLLAIAVIAAVAAIAPAAAEAAAPTPQRVIVQLNAPANATPEQITALTDTVLALLPASSFTVNNRYSTLPYVALSAGPTALSVLKQSGLVVSVYDDEVVSATAASSSKKGKNCKKPGKKSKKPCKKKPTTKKS
jgi:hypothetical protein